MIAERVADTLPVEPDEVYVFPASFGQQRLWFLDRFEPNSPYYNIPSAVRLTGVLNAAVLERALNEVVRRHEILRTTFAPNPKPQTPNPKPQTPNPFSAGEVYILVKPYLRSIRLQIIQERL